MTAAEALDHPWLKSTSDSNRSQNPERKWKETRVDLQRCSSNRTSAVPIQTLASIESIEKDGGGRAVGQRSKFETNWLNSSHPFVSVCLSMDEEETLDISRETMKKSQPATHLTEGTHLTASAHLTHPRLSSTLSPTASICPLLVNQKGDTVIEQEEAEEQDTTDKAPKTIVEQYAILAETNANVPDTRVNKYRRKRAGDEASKTILDAKKKRPRVSENEDIYNFEATSETPMSAGFPKIRRAKRKKGRIAQDIKIKD